MSLTESDGPVIDEEARRQHALRQPLAAIFAAATAMRMRPELADAERSKLIEIIIRNAERLTEMLDEPRAP